MCMQHNVVVLSDGIEVLEARWLWFSARLTSLTVAICNFILCMEAPDNPLIPHRETDSQCFISFESLLLTSYSLVRLLMKLGER